MDNLEKDAGLVKSLFKLNAPIAAISAIPIGLGLNQGTMSTGTAVKEGIKAVIPGGEAISQAAKDLGGALTLTASDDSDELLKQAFATIDRDIDSGDKVKDIITGAGVGAAAGVGSYLGINKLIDYVESTGAESGAVFGVDKALSDAGKTMANGATRNKPISRGIQTMMDVGGKFLGGQAGRESIRFDFAHAVDSVPTSTKLKNLALYLGIIGASVAAEDYVIDKGKSLASDVVTHFKTSADISDLEKLSYEDFEVIEDLDSQLKEAALKLSVTTNRMLYDRIYKPVISTGTMLFSLGALSNLIGRNMYGGFERIDKNEQRTPRVIIDMPKEASIDKESASLESAKDLLTSIIAKGGSPIRDGIKNFDEWVAAGERGDYKFHGHGGLSHTLLEEVPFKVVEGISYAVPMMVGAAFGRNVKRGFIPLQDDPTAPQLAPGMQRVIIQTGSGDIATERKVAKDAFEGFLDEALEKYAGSVVSMDFFKAKKLMQAAPTVKDPRTVISDFVSGKESVDTLRKALQELHTNKNAFEAFVDDAVEKYAGAEYSFIN